MGFTVSKRAGAVGRRRREKAKPAEKECRIQESQWRRTQRQADEEIGRGEGEEKKEKFDENGAKRKET